MKTYKNLFSKILEEDVRKTAVHNVYLKRKDDKYIINNNMSEDDMFVRSAI